MEVAKEYAAKQFVFPDNTTRNYNAQSKHIGGHDRFRFYFYYDPQTSGGLLFSFLLLTKNDMDELLKSKTVFF